MKKLFPTALLAFGLASCSHQPAIPAIAPPTLTLPAPVQPVSVPAGPQVSTSSGVLIVFRETSTVITNYSSTATTVCVNAECADLPANHTATADSGAVNVQKISVYGAELTFNSGGSFMRPTSGALITTRRISTHSGTPLLIGDNIPGSGEAWSDRAGEIKQLVIEHLN